jgi:hypothetical protein
MQPPEKGEKAPATIIVIHQHWMFSTHTMSQYPLQPIGNGGLPKKS